VIFAAAVLSACAWSATQSVHAQDRLLSIARPAEVGLDSAQLARADSVAERDLPALLSLLVVRHGKLAWERYYHGANRETPINVKSVTKSIQGAMVGIALRDSLIRSLDQTVASILPELFDRPAPSYKSFAAAIGRVQGARRLVTIRHLLTMSGGFGWEESGPILDAFLVSPHPAQFVAELAIVTNPGQSFNYTTGGTHLLSAAIGRVVRTSPRAYAEQQLLTPAGIELLDWDADPQGINLGGSEIMLRSIGMARFGLLFLGRGRIDDRQVVPAEWVDSSWVRRFEVPSPLYRQMIPGLDGYGYLWWRRVVAGVTWHCALGFGGQFVLVAPNLDMVVAGGSALDARSPGPIQQFQKIFQLLDSHVQPAVRPGASDRAAPRTLARP
jgi:CubicO group peptidase (beta-lactamase class C family)